MDNKVKQVFDLIGHLDEFVGGLNMPRQFHVQWQGLYQNVEGKIREILVPEKPSKVPNQTAEKPKKHA